MALQTARTNVGSYMQQQPVYQQQKSHKNIKQKQQYVPKESVYQQQPQYQHQKFHTQHQAHHKTYDNRKSSQTFHHGHPSHQQQQQTTKSMSWMNCYDFVQTQPSSRGTNAAASITVTISSKQQSRNYAPGCATKKYRSSNQGHSGATNTSNISAAPTSFGNAVETPSPLAISMVPQVTNTTPAAPSTQSWASLFANSSNSAGSAISNTASPASNLSTTSSSSSTTTACSRKLKSLANLDEYSLKFAEFLTKYKSDSAVISLRPRGLRNRSNYCYINSILQALLGCSPLYHLIRSIPKQAANFCEVNTPAVNAMITFMSNFSNLPDGLSLRKTKGGKGNKNGFGGTLQCDSAFEPTEIYKLWNDSREENVLGRQEDAEEFLSYILNKLNDEMLEITKVMAQQNTEQIGKSETPKEDGDVWQATCNNRDNNTHEKDFGCTPLSDIFRGELRSRLQREGEHPTDVTQPFFTLQLNIEKAASVKEALEILVGRAQLEGVTSSKSNQEVAAWQQMNLEKLPPILILHLKCFEYRSYGCTKILKKVEFPVGLQIDAKILASKRYSQKQRAYRLFAVVYHDGRQVSRGHYIADVYHSGYGWLRYDDSSVKPVSENDVLLPGEPRVPYLLWYRRCDTIPQQSNNNQNNSPTGNNNSSGNTQSSSEK